VKSTAPKIGFDRFIRLDWALAALKVSAGITEMGEFSAILDAAGMGAAAKTKTRTVLNRMWLDPRPELVDFANRGAAIYRAQGPASVAALCWGAAIATYPFFGKVAELIGRLSALQGDCTSAEVHRRMSETYGEREGTYRMTNMVIQTQANWGVLERIDGGKRIVRLVSVTIDDDALAAWLIEGAVRCLGKSASLSSLQSAPVLFPFAMARPLAFAVSSSFSLQVRSDGPSHRVVSVR